MRSLRLGLFSLLIVVVTGCGGGDSTDTPSNPGTPGETQDLSQVGRLLEQAHRVPAQASQEAQTALTASIQAVVEASRLAGGAITTSGRLVQSAPRGAFSLQPSAGDALEVVFFDENENRREFAFTYVRLETASTTADDILNGDHRLEVGVTNPDDTIAVTIRSTRVGRQVNGQVEGKYSDAGITYQLDLTLDDTTLIREIDLAGSHFKNEATLQGMITAPDLSLTVRQNFAFELITSSSGATFSANTSDTIIQHTLVIGDDDYVWDGVQIRRNFRDGTISEADTYWQANGVVRRNNAAFGEYALDAQLLDPDGQGFVYVDLQLPNEVIRLESWGQLQ